MARGRAISLAYEHPGQNAHHHQTACPEAAGEEHHACTSPAVLISSVQRVISRSLHNQCQSNQYSCGGLCWSSQPKIKALKQVFLSSDLDLLLTCKYPHLAKWITPFQEAACICQVVLLHLTSTQEEGWCSTSDLQEQSPWWPFTRMKGGRSCAYSHQEVLAESNGLLRGLRNLSYGKCLAMFCLQIKYSSCASWIYLTMESDQQSSSRSAIF